MPIKVKEEHLNTVVGFNKSGKPLGQRNDLHVLVRLGNRNPSFLDLFEELPSDEELEEMERKSRSHLENKRNALAARRKQLQPQGAVTRTTNKDAGQ